MERIVNINEIIFKDKLTAKLGELDDVCSCEECINDMLTFALNKMPVHYVDALETEIMKKAAIESKKIDYDAAVEEAIKQVGKAPRHDKHESLEFYNVTEANVYERMPMIVESSDMCECDRCRNDVLCLACNSLPPRYVNSAKGDIYERIEAYDKEEKKKIDEAILKAVEIVKANPRHE